MSLKECRTLTVQAGFIPARITGLGHGKRNIGPVHCGQLIPFLGIGRGYWRVLVGGSQDALHADPVFIRDGQAQAHVAGDLLCIGDASRRRAVSGEQRIRCACRTALPVDGDDALSRVEVVREVIKMCIRDRDETFTAVENAGS